MGLAVLPGYQDQVCLANPVALFIDREHIFENKLLPRHQRHLYDLTEILDILQLVFAL